MPGLRVLIAAVLVTLLASPAWASGKKKPEPRPLDLTLSAADLTPANPPSSPGMSVSLAESPWLVLEPEAQGPGTLIPQLDRDEPGGRNGINQNLLVRVLDGETIPVLTIRVVPPPSPELAK